MKATWKCFLVVLLLSAGAPRAVRAGQQVYLSESPNGKYRVFIEQVIERRVGDRIFFRYPITLVNTKNLRRHFEIRDGGSPLVQETEKGTFKIRWDGADSREPSSIHFYWSPDSLRFFMGLEVIQDSWKTFFVDVNTGKTTDITPDLEGNMVGKIDFHKWDCEQPRVQFVKWTEPHLAFLKLTSVCGKNRGKENEKLFFMRDSILFDTIQYKVVQHCMDCEDHQASRQFQDYFTGTIPTPTPTPEETPTVQ